MANSAAVCNTFKRDLLNGLHAFGASVIRGATTKDSFKGALYLASASLGASTTAYSGTGEVSGTNYTAGGSYYKRNRPDFNKLHRTLDANGFLIMDNSYPVNGFRCIIAL